MLLPNPLLRIGVYACNYLQFAKPFNPAIMIDRITIKRAFVTIPILITLVFIACQKELSVNRSNEKYTSLTDFYAKNIVPVQHFGMPVETGGTFTTTSGTKVTIPANAFIDADGDLATGKIDIEFREIYKKSEMLLSAMPTISYGKPIKSGGEFFVRARAGTKTLQLRGGRHIDFEQPFAATGGVDKDMKPFIAAIDNGAVNWAAPMLDSVGAASDTLHFTASSYVFSLYQFSNPVENGTWCNSDNDKYFNGYPLTTLTMVLTDTGFSNVDVFLVFKDVNAMVHVYETGINTYAYSYAPEGLNCTVVAISTKDEKLYSSFTPITISSNQTVNFSLAATTLDEFKAHLELLNH